MYCDRRRAGAACAASSSSASAQHEWVRACSGIASLSSWPWAATRSTCGARRRLRGRDGRRAAAAATAPPAACVRSLRQRRAAAALAGDAPLRRRSRMKPRSRRAGRSSSAASRGRRRRGAGAERAQQQRRLLLHAHAGERGRGAAGTRFRVGGLVEEGSLQREHGMTVRFVVTDTARDMPVRYTGILPDLFKEGKGAVAQGRLGADGVFIATEVLAKHDENYMPPEAAARARRRRASTRERGRAGTMIAELGHFALILALLRGARAGRAAAGRRAPRHGALDGARPGRPRRRSSCSSRSPSRCLTHAFLANDFSVLYVASTPTRSCRRPTASPPSGAATKARCCCGC